MITLKENTLDLDTYFSLRASVGWKLLTNTQAEKALKNSLITITAYENNVPVGMGRIVGDGAVICYVQDLVVHPDYQKLGVGRLIMERLIKFVSEVKEKDSEIMMCLMCAKGREHFYEKFGFVGRPTEDLGPGMIQYIRY
ncbi:MAG: GNAT family N-acetyltransferase [Lachnospiraceae bacterium]